MPDPRAATPVHVMSRLEIDGDFRLGNTDDIGALISLADAGTSEPWFLEEAANQGIEVLRLEFDDVDYETRDAPDEVDAEMIVDFLKEVLPLPEGQVLIIHCEAGISRSTATAAAALKVMEPELRPEQIALRIYEDRPIASPNTLLLSLMEPYLGVDEGDMVEVAQHTHDLVWGPEENPAPRTRYQDLVTYTDHADILTAFFAAIENAICGGSGGIAIYRDVDGEEEYPGGIDFRVWRSGRFSFDPPTWSGYFLDEARYGSHAVYLDWKDALMAKMQKDRAWQTGEEVAIYSGAYRAGRSVNAHGDLRLVNWDWFVNEDYPMYASKKDLIAELAAAIDAYPVPKMLSSWEARDIGYHRARAFRYGSDF